MGYTTRDLQHKTKEILDTACTVPVRIRRGDEFFEISKVRMVPSENIENPKKSVATQEVSYVDDSQEWEPPVQTPTGTVYTTSIGKPTLDDLMESGLVKKGTV